MPHSLAPELLVHAPRVVANALGQRRLCHDTLYAVDRAALAEEQQRGQRLRGGAEPQSSLPQVNAAAFPGRQQQHPSVKSVQALPRTFTL